MGENDERPRDALDARLQVFDKTHSGRITIFDTLFGKMKKKKKDESVFVYLFCDSIVSIGLSFIDYFACCLFDAHPIVTSFLSVQFPVHLSIPV